MTYSLLNKIELYFRDCIVIDNFFSTEICTELRNFALSTPNNANKLVYGNGYTATNFDNGYGYGINPSIISYIKSKVPILSNKKYSRSWCFLYNNICRGVLPHADPSSFNVNVWVTPSESVFDKNKNGLILYKKRALTDMTWNQYNRDNEYIKKYLDGSKSFKIPYKFNRAVIFPGKIFHTTDNVHMKPGDNNKRINYTFLFD
jgi:hypothetical protein